MNVLSSPFQRLCIASSKSRPLFQKFPIHHNKGLKTTYNNINNNHINLRFFSNSTSSTTTSSPTSLAYSRSFAYQKNGNRGSWNWSSWTRGRTGWKGVSVVSTIGLGGIAVSLATYSRPAVLCEGSHLPSPTRTTILKKNSIYVLFSLLAPIRSEFSYPPSYQGSPPDLPPLPSVPQSSLKLYELGFGAITGICAGVFIKKGARALAFILGGVFVILQVSLFQFSINNETIEIDRVLFLLSLFKINTTFLSILPPYV